MSRSMRVVKCPSDTLSMTNRVVVNSEDWDIKQTPHLQAGLADWLETVKLANFYLFTFGMVLEGTAAG